MSSLIIFSGQVAIEWIKENVPTIVEAFYPGEQICTLFKPSHLRKEVKQL